MELTTPQQAIQITTTCDRREPLETLARSLVERRLAACVQIGGPFSSVYRWQGQVDSAEEWMCFIKTVAGRFSEVLDQILQNHPYDNPEVIAVPIIAGSADYLAWIADESGPESPQQ